MYTSKLLLLRRISIIISPIQKLPPGVVSLGVRNAFSTHELFQKL